MTASELAEMRAELDALRAKVQANSERWATVTQASPLRVRLDGDTTAPAVTPETLVNGLEVNDRVRVQLSDSRMLVTGRAGGTVAASIDIGLMSIWTSSGSIPAKYVEAGTTPLRSAHPDLFDHYNPLLGTFTFGITNDRINIDVDGLVVGQRVWFTTTDTLATGFAENTEYWVVQVDVDDEWFKVSATEGGAAIAVSDQGTGTHSVYLTEWGIGDGSTTFDTPPMPGRTPIGVDTGDPDFDILGRLFGEKTHLLTGPESGIQAHTPTQNSHDHTVRYKGFSGLYAGSGWYLVRRTDSADSYTGTDSNGANAKTATNKQTPAADATEAHNNVQPSVAVRWVIRAEV